MIARRTFLGAAAAAGTGAAPARRTNILLITADDLGLQLGCYGEKRVRTPNMDRLAASGVRFETAYITQASCSPSRSSIFTGLYPHGTGQYGLANTGFHLHPHLLHATLPAVLKGAGYRTGVVGKVHVEPEDRLVFDFDKRRSHGATRNVRAAAALAREFFQTVKDQPFFLMMNYADPHAFREANDRTKWYFPRQVEGLPEHPLEPGPATLWNWQGIDTPASRARVANYLNAVRRFDDGLGMLMDELRRAGRLEDTLVIMIGDNGPPFERGKTTCYEAGLRTPFLVRWPGVSRPMVSKALVSSVDIATTIFDAAGARSPVATHGRSLRPVLSGAPRGWREYLAGEFHYHGANRFFPRRAIRGQRYKLIHNLLAGKAKPPTGIDGDAAFGPSRHAAAAVRETFDRYAGPPEWELYDLQRDPVEFVNLAARPEFARERERLQAALLAWRKDTRDPFLDPAFVDELIRLGAPVQRGRKNK